MFHTDVRQSPESSQSCEQLANVDGMTLILTSLCSAISVDSYLKLAKVMMTTLVYNSQSNEMLYAWSFSVLNFRPKED